MEIKVFSESIDSLKNDVLTLGFFSDERPPRGYCGQLDWRLNGIISTLMAKGRIGGTFMEKVLISPNGRIPSTKILLIGLGDLARLTYDTLYTTGQTMAQTLSDMACDEYVFDIPGTGKCELDVAQMATTMISGFTDGLAARGVPDGNTLPISILGDEDHMAEIILGMHTFKVAAGKGARITIREVVT